LSSWTTRAYPNIILGEKYEPETTYDEAPDGSAAADSPIRPRRKSSNASKGRDEDKAMVEAMNRDKQATYRKDMFTALNEVGWKRRDVLGYGHDQLLQDPTWWFTDRSGTNTVVEHLCQNFMSEIGHEEAEPNAAEDEEEEEEGVWQGEATKPVENGRATVKKGSLIKNQTTGLFFFAGKQEVILK